MKRSTFIITLLVLASPITSPGQELPTARRPSEPVDIVRYTTVPKRDETAAWSPDGKWIAFVSTRGGSRDVWVKPAAGGDARQLTNYPGYDRYLEWTPDGKLLTFMSDRDDYWNLYTVDPSRAAEESVRQITTAADSVVRGQFDWSRDGREIIYEAKNGEGSHAPEPGADIQGYRPGASVDRLRWPRSGTLPQRYQATLDSISVRWSR